MQHKEGIMNYTIKIEEFGIVIDLYEEKSVGASRSIPIRYADGEIRSSMHKEEMPSRLDYPHSSHHDYNDELTARAFYNAMIDAIEAMILAHAVAGIDVTEERYINGISASVKEASKEYGD